eukprot:14059978-Ditylum_brightwellii.AAC.1
MEHSSGEHAAVVVYGVVGGSNEVLVEHFVLRSCGPSFILVLMRKSIISCALSEAEQKKGGVIWMDHEAPELVFNVEFGKDKWCRPGISHGGYNAFEC